MKYSALIFDEKLDHEDSLSNLEEIARILKEDDSCRQIIVSCSQEEMLHLAKTPIAKAMYVAKLPGKYASLLNALKAVVEDDVLIFGLSQSVYSEDIQSLLKALVDVPAVSLHKDARGFDTRLLMFTLQKAMDEGFDMEDYTDAINQYADFPIRNL